MNLMEIPSNFNFTGAGTSDQSDHSYILLDFGAPLEFEDTEFSCLLCSSTTQLTRFDQRILEDEVCQLKAVISEITSLDPEIVVAGEEVGTTFCCPSCLMKLQLLKETYDSTAKLQHQLKCVSTAISYQLLNKHNLQNDGHSSSDKDVEWDAQFHEWNESRLENLNVDPELNSDTLLETGLQILGNIHRENENEESSPRNGTTTTSHEEEFSQVEALANDVHEYLGREIYGTVSAYSGAGQQHISSEDTASRTESVSHVHAINETIEFDDNSVRSPGVNANDHNHNRMECQQSRLEFPCPQCSRLFVTQEGLSDHIQRKHEPAEKYPCLKCEKVYVQKRSLIYHMNTFHGQQKPAISSHRLCPLCDKALSNKFYLLKHLYKHKKEFPNGQLPCRICGKQFGSAELILAHTPTHRGKYKCPQPRCYKSFTRKSNLDEHLKLHDENFPLFSCNFCFRSFDSQSRLEEHVGVKHEDLINQNQKGCQTCGESFPTETLLRDHRKTHSTLDFPCEFCENSYRTRFEWTTHQESEHKNEKPHRCEQCDATFRLKSHLNTHLKRHAKFPFQCDHCTSDSSSGAPKRFAREHEYRSHMSAMHPGIHPRHESGSHESRERSAEIVTIDLV